MTDPPPEQPPDPVPNEPQGDKAAAPASRRRAIIFITVFLVTTFGLLTVFQMLSGSVYMKRYLFIVAGHTAAVLDLVGESAYLEYKDPADLPRDEQGQLRAEITAWSTGEAAPTLPPAERAEGAPLSRWEWFQHRSLRDRFEFERERSLAEALAAAERQEVFDNPQQHLAHLAERAAVVRASIERVDPNGTRRELGDLDAINAWRAAQTELDEVMSRPFVVTNQSLQTLMAIDEGLEAARQLQLDFAMRRTAHLQKFLDNAGPLVYITWRSGLRGELDAARDRLAAINRDPSLDEGDRVRALDAARADIRAIETEIGAQRRAGASPKVVDGQQFRFTVIPECGAIEVMIIYIAAILGFPTAWTRRLAGIVLGLPLLYAVNIFRLACLGLIGAWYEQEVFDFAHHYVWQAVYLIFVVIIWLLWMEIFVRRGEGRSQATA